MTKVRLGDVVKRVKENVDRETTDLVYYIGGEHFDERALKVTRKGIIKGSKIGPAFNTKFSSGDVLLMSRNPHLRKAGMVDFEGICSDVSYIIRTKDEKVLMQKFIPLLFQSDAFWKFSEKNKKGSTNFFLNWSDFERFEFDLPTIEIQQKLCSTLWSINNTIESYKRMIDKSDELVTAVLIEMFGDIFNSESKYPLIKIGEVVAPKIARASKNFSLDDEICYIDISSIDNSKNIIIGYTKYLKKNAPSRAQQHVRKNDIVISTVRPNLNNVARIPYDYDNIVASSGFCVLRAINVNTEYLFGIVSRKLFANYLSSLTTGANYPAVSDKDILSFEIPNAPIEKQLEFADFLKNIEISKEELQKGIVTSTILFKKIINLYIKED